MVAGGVKTLPDSCLKVAEALASSKKKGITQSELRSKLGLSKRTIKYALKRLEQCRLIYCSSLLIDTRRKIYFANNKSGVK